MAHLLGSCSIRPVAVTLPSPATATSPFLVPVVLSRRGLRLCAVGPFEARSVWAAGDRWSKEDRDHPRPTAQALTGHSDHGMLLLL